MRKSTDQNESGDADKSAQQALAYRTTPPLAGLAFCFLTLLIIIAYLPTVISLHQRWLKFDQTYSHGYGVAGILIYFLWSRRAELFTQTSKPQLLLLLPLFAGAALAITAQLSHTAVITQLLLPALLWLSFSTVFGLTSGWRLLPYLALLYFAIPVWSVISPYLQQLTVTVSGLFLSLFNISAFIQDSYVHISEGTFHIASGCSGLNYFLVSLLTAALYSLEFRLSTKHSLLLFSMAALLAIISNWIRVTSLIVLGHMAGLSHPLILDHAFHGWLINGFFIVLLFIFASRHLPEGKLKNRVIENTQEKHRQLPLAFGAFFSVALILIMPLYIGIIAKALSPALIPAFEQYDVNTSINDNTRHLKGWKIKHSDKNSWHPELKNADFSIGQRWFNGYESIDVSITGYLAQAQGKELINSGNIIFSPQWQSIVENNKHEYSNAIVQSGTGQRYAIRYWFQLGKKTASSTLEVKLLSALSNLTGISNGAFVLIQTPCVADCDQASTLLDSKHALIKGYIDHKVLGVD